MMAARRLVYLASDWLERAGAVTRALLLVTAALTGALLYMAANWPGSQPTIRAASISQRAVAAAPPPPPVLAVRAADSVAAGTAVMEAVRAVGAASTTLTQARASQTADAASPPPAAMLPNIAAAGARSLGAAPVSSAATARTGATTGRPALNAADPQAPVVADLDAATGAPRQPVHTQGEGPNRIAVPGFAPQPPGSNHIAVPPAQPPR